MSLVSIIKTIAEALALLGLLTGWLISLSKIFSGHKCLLRSEILRIYYHNKDSQKIRQYEYENIVMLYEAYKGLRGNSFVDKIYDEIKSWEVVS